MQRFSSNQLQSGTLVLKSGPQSISLTSNLSCTDGNVTFTATAPAVACTPSYTVENRDKPRIPFNSSPGRLILGTCIPTSPNHSEPSLSKPLQTLHSVPCQLDLQRKCPTKSQAPLTSLLQAQRALLRPTKVALFQPGLVDKEASNIKQQTKSKWPERVRAQK